MTTLQLLSQLFTYLIVSDEEKVMVCVKVTGTQSQSITLDSCSKNCDLACGIKITSDALK